MKNKEFSLGVFACIFNRDLSKILLLRRNQEKRKKSGAVWGNVGGRVEFGEKTIDACIREIREEIGIRLNPEKLKLADIKESPHFSEKFHAIHFVYVAMLDENEKLVLNDESEEYKWFKLKELPDKTFDSKEYLIKLSIIAKKKFLGNE